MYAGRVCALSCRSVHCCGCVDPTLWEDARRCGEEDGVWHTQLRAVPVDARWGGRVLCSSRSRQHTHYFLQTFIDPRPRTPSCISRPLRAPASGARTEHARTGRRTPPGHVGACACGPHARPAGPVLVYSTVKYSDSVLPLSEQHAAGRRGGGMPDAHSAVSPHTISNSIA